MSLIKYQFSNQDQLFAYYDGKNKTRLRKLREKAQETQMQTEDLRKTGSTVLSILRKIAAHGKVAVNLRQRMQQQSRQQPREESATMKKESTKKAHKGDAGSTKNVGGGASGSEKGSAIQQNNFVGDL